MGLLKALGYLHKQKIKILLVQIANKNFGDSVIADNTRFLLNRAFRSVPWKKFEIFDYAIGTEDLAQIQYVDAIVFAGGGLIKFRQENLYRQVSEIIMEAQRYAVPVFLNSVGVEGYDEKDERCLQLVEAINQPCVKLITVRDDVSCLISHYIKNCRIRIREVYDPAINSPTTYSVQKQNANKVIGLGIAREDLYVDYGIPSVDRKFLIDFWKNVVRLLEQRGYQWQIFTNGLDKDELFAQVVLNEIGHGSKIKQPFDARELVTQISQMKGMIACRMHSNIISYSFGIPSIGLVWNDKMTFWGNKCGYPNRYIPYTQLKAEKVVAALDEALQNGCKKPSWKKRYTTYHEIRYFVRRYCRLRQKQVVHTNLDKHMVAAALGGYEYKYKNLNSLSQMEQSIKQGFSLFELDVRMTKDSHLVCVNGWGKNIWHALGFVDGQGEMELSKFLEACYYHHFQTCTFDRAIDYFTSQNENAKKYILILDVGKPKTELLDSFYTQLVDTLNKYNVSSSSIIIRFQREKDVNAFFKQNFNCCLAYFLSAEVEGLGEDSLEYRKIIDFCKKKKINILSMTDKTWNKDLQERLKTQKLDTMVLTYTKTGDILEAIQTGAKYVATHYYSVEYMNKLLQ